MEKSFLYGLLVLAPILVMAGTIKKATDCTGPYTKLDGNMCYEMYTTKADWSEAYSLCKADGGNMVAITDATVQATVEALLTANNVYTKVWTGAILEDPEKQSGKPTTLWRLVPNCWGCDIPTICNPSGVGTSAMASGAGSTTSTDEVGNLDQGGLDICFVMDNSGSVSDDDWTNTVLEFITSFVDRLEIGSTLDKAQVAAVKFGNTAELEFYLKDFKNKNSLKDKVRKIHHQPENTNTSAGIEMARSLVFSTVTGDRRGAQNVMILFTDGISTFNASDTVSQAQKSKDEGIISFVVGVTSNVNEFELRNISDSPQKEGVTYWMVPSFTDVTENVIDQIFERMCDWKERNWMMTRTAVEAQGCHDEPPVTSYKQSLDLPNLVTTSSSMTVDMCITACKENGFDYASPRGENCFCGNEFGKNGISNNCNTPCPGDPSQICGGPSANSVYYVSGTKQAVWSAGEPKDNFYAWCGTLKHSDYYYASVVCNSKYRFHCKLPKDRCSSTSNDGTYNKIANSYCVYTSDDAEMWFDARIKCREKSGDLLTMDTENDRLAVTEAIKQSVTWGLSDTHSHIGLYKRNYYIPNEDHQAGDDLTYVNFDPDAATPQPDPSDGDCIELRRDPQSNGIYWYTAKCTNRQNFICEWQTDGSATPPTTTTSTTTTSTTTSATPTTVASTDASKTEKQKTPKPKKTKKPTVTVTTTSETNTAVSTNTGSGPNAGASTNNESSGLSITYIILIVVLIILAILIICIVIWFLCGRNKTSHGTIHPRKPANKYDARPDAPVPQTGNLGYGMEEGVDGGEDFEYGSTTGMVR